MYLPDFVDAVLGLGSIFKSSLPGCQIYLKTNLQAVSGSPFSGILMCCQFLASSSLATFSLCRVRVRARCGVGIPTSKPPRLDYSLYMLNIYCGYGDTKNHVPFIFHNESKLLKLKKICSSLGLYASMLQIKPPVLVKSR